MMTDFFIDHTINSSYRVDVSGESENGIVKSMVDHFSPHGLL